MVGVAQLLAEADKVGLQVRIDGSLLVVRGPKKQRPLAERLLDQKSAVIEALMRSPPPP